MNKTNISAEPVLPLLRARRDVLDAHLGDCHFRHVDQSVDSKFPSDRRHGHGRFLVTGGYGHAEVHRLAAGNHPMHRIEIEQIADHDLRIHVA
jgi:predicted LPLAT superfamily acyltransferase